MATRYSHTWPFGDEWGVIARTRGAGWLSSAFDGFNGHLMIGNFVLYRLQRVWFGLDGNRLVFGAFCASLASLQVSVAAVLRRLGLPLLIALLAASIVTYFGPGAADMVWEFQMSVNFALALCFAAAFVALRDDPSRGAAATIAALLILALAADSALADYGALYVGILVVALWPRRRIAFALGPPFVAYVAWFIFGNHAVYLRATRDVTARFAFHLFTLAAGGLVGGGQTRSSLVSAIYGRTGATSTVPLSGETVGVIALVVAGTCTAYGFARHRLPRKVVVSLIGGLLAALLTTAAVAQTRAFMVRPMFLPGSRFVHWVALFLLLAFAPAIAASMRPRAPQAGRRVTVAVAAALVAVFILNLGQLWPVRQFFDQWNQQVKSSVRQTLTLVTEGCGDGSRPKPSARPTTRSPEITVGLLQELLGRGELTPGFGTPATPKVRDVVCSPTASVRVPSAPGASP